MCSSNRSIDDSTPTIQTLLGALRDLRHEIEFTSTHPDIALDGLSFVLDAAGSLPIQALYRSGHDAEAESLARVMTPAKELGSVEAVAALWAEVSRLLICLPLDTKPITRRQRMALAETELKIQACPKQLSEEETAPSLEVNLERGYLEYGPQRHDTGSKTALKILSILNKNRNSSYSAQQLMDLAWTESIVTDDAVRKQVGQAKKLLAKVTRDLKIDHRRGYGWELIRDPSDG